MSSLAATIHYFSYALLTSLVTCGSRPIHSHTSLFDIMHDIAVVPKFAIDGVWINYLMDFDERFNETISVCSVDEKGHLSEIIGHSTSLCNQCCDSSHSMAMI